MPPKVSAIPHFPMVREENARQGFLTNKQYARLRDALPDYLRPLFVVAHFTGIRPGELLAWTWDKVHFKQRLWSAEQPVRTAGSTRRLSDSITNHVC